MILATQLAWRSLKNHLRFSTFFTFNLALALSGLTILYSLQESINVSLKERAKVLLGADLFISSYQKFDKNQVKLIDDTLQPVASQSDQVKLFSMVVSNQRSKLTHVIGIDSQFPLYGELTLESGEPSLAEKQDFASQPKVWASPEFLESLRTSQGEMVKIGQVNFEITGIIAEAPPETLSLFAGIPKIYVSVSQLKQTGLLEFGSRILYGRFYKLDQPTEEVAERSEKIREVLRPSKNTVSEIRIRTITDSNSQFGDLTQRLGRFLGLSALTALFLGGVGVAYLFRHFLESQLQSFAILMSLGSSRSQAQLVVLMQLVLLGIAGSLLALGMTSLFMSLASFMLWLL